MRKAPPAWVRPTAALVPWVAVAAPLAAATAFARVLRSVGPGLPPLLGAAAMAAVAAAVALALDDPAHELTAALPVSRAWRALHRMVLVVPPLLCGWLLASSTLVPDETRSDAVAVVVSLAALAVAVASVVGRVRPATAAAAGAAAPFALLALHLLASNGGGRWSPTEAWVDHPWAASVVAGLVAAVALREGSVVPRRGAPQTGSGCGGSGAGTPAGTAVLQARPATEAISTSGTTSAARRAVTSANQPMRAGPAR